MAEDRAQSDRRAIASARRLVVKVGSAVVSSGGRLDQGAVERLAQQVAAMRERGVEVALVSSGAVACGLADLGLSWPVRTVVEKQAAAAVGQPVLAAAWSAALRGRGFASAQVLLSADDLGDRGRFLNARRTLETLLERGVVPVVNENDSVATEELRFGDNDRLSALVADLVDADTLVVLSKAEGLLDGDGQVIGTVTQIESARAHVKKELTGTGVGGMGAKLDAAEIATRAGVHAVIAGGSEERVLERLLGGEALGTFFPAADRSPEARKRWLWSSASARGTVLVDSGAQRALVEGGASLLPRGVTGVDGDFTAGAAVRIAGPRGEFARGLASYGSAEIRAIAGRKASEIAGVLGDAYSDEVVHRDDMVITDRGNTDGDG